MTKLTFVLASLCMLVAACDSSAPAHKTFRSLVLNDADRDGLMESAADAPGDVVILPASEDCPVMHWTESTDENGQTTICTQCYDADDQVPIGDAACTVAPPIACEQLEPDDTTQSCWRCVDPDGNVIDEGCVTLPTTCSSDADCAANEECWQWDTGSGPTGGEDGGEGPTCVEPPPVPNGGECVPRVVECQSDADCADGETCYKPDVLISDANGDGVPDQLPPDVAGFCAISGGGAPQPGSPGEPADPQPGSPRE